MFEQGDGTKLNDEVIAKLAKKFAIELKAKGEVKGETTQNPPPILPNVPVHGFCPNPHCPTNHAYTVDGRVYFRPERLAADPVGGKFCALCGEILEKRCPNCAAPVHDGGICSLCGEPYLASNLGD